MYGEMGKEETRPNVVFVETLTEGPDHWMFRKIILSCLDTLRVVKGIHTNPLWTNLKNQNYVLSDGSALSLGGFTSYNDIYNEHPLCMKTSNRGKPVLVDQAGFEYRLAHVKGNRSNWRCRSGQKCGARAITEGPDYVIVKKRNIHTCQNPQILPFF